MFSILSISLLFLWIWLVISVFIDIFRSLDLNGWGKASWSAFVIVLPLLGVLIGRSPNWRVRLIVNCARQRLLSSDLGNLTYATSVRLIYQLLNTSTSASAAGRCAISNEIGRDERSATEIVYRNAADVGRTIAKSIIRNPNAARLGAE